MTIVRASGIIAERTGCSTHPNLARPVCVPPACGRLLAALRQTTTVGTGELRDLLNAIVPPGVGLPCVLTDGGECWSWFVYRDGVWHSAWRFLGGMVDGDRAELLDSLYAQMNDLGLMAQNLVDDATAETTLEPLVRAFLEVFTVRLATSSYQ